MLQLALMLGLGERASASVPSVAQNDAAKVEASFDYVRWRHHRHRRLQLSFTPLRRSLALGGGSGKPP